MVNRVFYLIFLWLFMSQALAVERVVPNKLFGIELGGIYDIGDSESGSLGDIPVNKFAGMSRFLGQGIHYYFQPKVDNKFFEYVEKPEKPDDKYFRTSYRLYLLPVIPPSIKTIEDLNLANLKMQVTHIEWENEAKTKDDAYYWAIDLCKTMGTDIAIKPKILNFYEEKHYSCTFSSDDRELEISSFYSRRISLTFNRIISDKKQKSVESIIRRLQAKAIKPY